MWINKKHYKIISVEKTKNGIKITACLVDKSNSKIGYNKEFTLDASELDSLK